jgi:uncharacterized protein
MEPDAMEPPLRNELAHASSPYLRQHASNPVQWQEWNRATLAHARATDTPILLSIGYSACHWCHVMAHESFEDEAIARAMNALFVNIKLDREERPDLDRVYQLAHQALSGRGGGWPLTVFLDPQDLAPFFAGTYFPPSPRHGLPGFGELLQRVREYFDGHRDELRQQNGRLREWLARADATPDDGVPNADVIALAAQRIAAGFDPENGGRRGAPKFPHAGELELLLDVAFETLSPRERGRREGSHLENPREEPSAHPSLRADKDGFASAFSRGEEQGESPTPNDCAAMALLTLRTMAARGLQDHLGGGFFRYCVDAAWTLPHFEKMLYDNAQLLPLYAHAAGAFEDPACAQAARGIFAWLTREMTAPNGAFYSALDADSKGADGRLDEGAFYLWTREELRAILDSAELAAIEAGYALEGAPNYEGRAWHLAKALTFDQIAQAMNRPAPEIQHLLNTAHRKLFDTRSLRARPATDDKILVAWNALMVSGLLRAARALRNPEMLAAAGNALSALRDGAWLGGELCANVVTEPQARIPGFLDDHAFLLDALVESLQDRWNEDDLAWAAALGDALLGKFEDPDHGGFFFSAAEHDTPLHNSKGFMDDALPNGNGVAARALLRLGHLLGETRWLDAAERTLRAAGPALRQYPDACAAMLRALREFHSPRTQVVIRCTGAEEVKWREALDQALRTHRMDRERADVFIVPADSKSLPGLLAQRTPREGGVAYVCSGMSCRAPIHSPTAMIEALRADQSTIG